ncbi:MAG: hypothetical protein ACI90V_013799, partial [Bacillariaceae sp.]
IDTTTTTSSKPEREKQQRQQHEDLFSSSPFAVAAAFPTVNATTSTSNNGDDKIVPAAKNTNNNIIINNKIVKNNEIQFPPNIVQQQQHLIQKEFQKQQQPTPIVKRLPTALRRSSFTGRDNGNNDNASCTSSSWIKIKNKRISRRTGTTTSSSVRWNDHVEELIFANHPNEHACSDDEDDDDTDDDYDDDNIDIDDRTEDEDIVEEEERNHRRQQQTKNNKKNQDGSFPRLIGSSGGDNNNGGTTNQNGESYSVTIKSPASVSGHSSSHRSVGNSTTTASNSKRSNNKNKKKPKIVIDSEELESHLKRMDNEAEKHFVQDFWDNFEESMDGIMSLVDSLGGDASKKSSNNKRSTSSWSSSILSSSKQQQRGRRNNKNNAAAGTISRSMSHDLISTNSTIYEEDEDAILKRSNSYPEGTMSQHESVSSPQQQKSNTLSSSLEAAKIITPDHRHHHHHDENTGSKRLDPPASGMQSPYDMVLNSWPFQSSSQNQLQHEEYASLSTKTPAVVSPQSARTMAKSTNQDSFPQSSSPRLTVTSSPSDATTSLASDILSQQQLKQKLFRPISPALSEASEAITNGFDGRSSNSNNNNRSLLSDDKFDLGSRISEMDSLDLNEFDNPFRQQPSSSSPIKRDGTSTTPLLPPSAVTMHISKSKNSQTEVDEEKKVDIKSTSPPNDTNNAATATTTSTKKSKFRVSMVSRIRGTSYDKEQQPVSHDQFSNKNGRTSRVSRAESMEDVFAGVDEGSKQQQCDVIDNDRRPLNLQDISIERSASHVSDLSESVYTSKKKNEDDEEGEGILYESRTADDPIVVSVSEGATVTFAPSTISESVMSSSTKKSIMMNSATRSSVRSEASTGYSSYASTRDTNSVHSLESAAVDSSGFFEYFIRYVTAIMTECANMGPTNGAPGEYHQDFMSLFSTDASAHTAEIPVKAEIPEQPSSMQRVPSSSTCSTRSSRGS